MSDKPDAGTLVLDQLRSSLDGSRYSLTAVYAAVIVAFGGALAVLLGISLGWHHLKEVYAPKPFLKSRLAAFNSPTYHSKWSIDAPNLRNCVASAWKCSEQSIMDEHGLDAAIYIRALRMFRNIFALLTLLVFCVAAPINVVFNLRTKYVESLTKKDALLLLTPTLLNSKQLIPHVVLGWITNSIVLLLLLFNYRRVLAMRRAVFSSSLFQQQLANRTVMLTDLPKNLRSSEGVARVLSYANPQTSPEAITLGFRNTEKLIELLDLYKSKLLQFEQEATKNSATSVKAQELKQKLAGLTQQIEALRSSHNFGAMLPDVYQLGNRSHKNSELLSSYGFASYASLGETHATVRGKTSQISGINVRIAPPQEQLIWKNMNLSAAQRGSKQLVMNLLYGVLLILWIVPSAFIGCFLANLNRLGAVWPAFGASMSQHPVWFAILQGALAPIITTSVFAALPFIFRKFSHLQGKVTRVDREHEVLRKLYAFFFLDNFFLFTIMGVVWDVVAQVLQQTQAARDAGQTLTFQEVWYSLKIAQRIATAIVNLSSFWVLYLLRGIFALFGGAAQPITLLKRLGQNLNFIQKPTPRERAENSMPQPFQYAVGFLSVLFNSTIALGFTSIQPLVLPIAMILFTLAVPLKKYEICHMQSTKYESNGMYWPLVSDILLFSLAVGNLILFCVVWVQGGWQIAVPVAPLVLTVIMFKIITATKIDSKFYYPDTTESPWSAFSTSSTSPTLNSKTSSVPAYDEKLTLASKDTDVDDDQPRLCEYYEDTAFSMPLESPLLTFEDAIISLSTHASRHGNARSAVHQPASFATTPATGEANLDIDDNDNDDFEYPQPPSSVGAVWLGNRNHLAYSPVSPIYMSSNPHLVGGSQESIAPQLSSHIRQDPEQKLLR